MAYTQFNEFDDENGTLVGSRRPSARPLARSLVPTIGFNDFVAQIDDEAPSTRIVIHVFEPSLSLCHQTDAHLEPLSLKYPDIKFLRISADEVGEVMYFDPVALPALLVYQGGGELTHCLLRMNDEVHEWHLNGSCSTTAFEAYLLQNDVLY
jgi:hypothetical protein